MVVAVVAAVVCHAVPPSLGTQEGSTGRGEVVVGSTSVLVVESGATVVSGVVSAVVDGLGVVPPAVVSVVAGFEVAVVAGFEVAVVEDAGEHAAPSSATPTMTPHADRRTCPSPSLRA